MERTARRVDRQAAVFGLLTALAPALATALCAGLATGCATVRQPPGGPYDASPPVLLGILPDSGAIVTGFDDEVEFQFDEVVDERSGGNLENLIHVSPRHDDLRVSWRRSRVTVKPRAGWLDGETYTVFLRPGIADLRQNRLDSATTIVFSTGTAIPATVISGNVVDWEGGSIARSALVELIRVADSVTYIGTTDSSGAFDVRGAPTGQYWLVATLDGNNNQRRERREAFDSVVVQLDSAATFDLWTFVHDSTGPTIRTATIVDSLAVSAEFTQSLAPEMVGNHTVRVLQLPDSSPVDVASILWRPDFDSLRSAQQDSIAAVADSIAAADQDSIAALQDSLGIDSLVVDPLARDSTVVDSIAEPEEVVESDSAAAQAAEEAARQDALLGQRPPIYNTFVILLVVELIPGEQYVIETRVANLLGHSEVSARSVMVPVPADTTTPPDST